MTAWRDGFLKTVGSIARKLAQRRLQNSELEHRRPVRLQACDRTRELLCLQMVRDGFPRVAACTMGRALAAVGARLGSPKSGVLHSPFEGAPAGWQRSNAALYRRTKTPNV